MMGRPPSRKDTNGNWLCYLCKEYKPLSAYYLYKNLKPMSSCKECSKLRDVYKRS